MFTGLVVERGRVERDPEPSGQGGVRLALSCSARLAGRLGVGASVAVSGVCLTVVRRQGEEFVVELSPETLARTNLGGLSRGSEVDLEPALTVGEALGGHWVQGHVDGVLEVLAREDHGEHATVWFALPPTWSPYVVEKGSVCLDGVSLTVADREAERFSVALIPHTLEVTTLGRLRPGMRVHFEADVLAKYVVHALTRGGLAALVDPAGPGGSGGSGGR